MISRRIADMTDAVTIRSSNSDYKLTVSEPRPPSIRYPVEYLRASLSGSGLKASATGVYLYDAQGLAQFFQDMAANWKGWEGEKTWSSIEGEFGLAATSDRLGHITLRIRLRS